MLHAGMVGDEFAVWAEAAGAGGGDALTAAPLRDLRTAVQPLLTGEAQAASVVAWLPAARGTVGRSSALLGEGDASRANDAVWRSPSMR